MSNFINYFDESYFELSASLFHEILRVSVISFFLFVSVSFCMLHAHFPIPCDRACLASACMYFFAQQQKNVQNRKRDGRILLTNMRPGRATFWTRIPKTVRGPLTLVNSEETRERGVCSNHHAGVSRLAGCCKTHMNRLVLPLRVSTLGNANLLKRKKKGKYQIIL